MNTRTRFATLTAVTTVLLAGCASSAEAPGTATASSPTAEVDYNETDVAFAQMMIPHHDDAIAISELLLESEGVRGEVADLATAIVAAQTTENEAMATWLEAQGAPVPDTFDGERASNPELDALTPAEREDAFLTSMINHHEHGVVMSDSAADLGKSTFMVELERSMSAIQKDEIALMKEWLDS